MVEFRTTCPRDCYDACGIVVSLLPGERPRVRGDRAHPVSRGQLCRKCSLAYNGVFLDRSARLTAPMRRTGPKGSGQFIPVPWDDRLASTMGYQQPELHESDADILAHLMAQSGTGLDFAELAAMGTIWPEDAPRIQFAGLRFTTPSGRIELASAAAESDGCPRIPQPLADPSPADDRLRLLSPSSEWSLNTTYGNDARVANRAGELVVTIHPDEALARGIRDGELVRVHNEIGELRLLLAVREDVPRRVALIPKGRWPKLEAGGGNVNTLNPGLRSDLGDSSAVHGTEVWVTPIQVVSDVPV